MGDKPWSMTAQYGVFPPNPLLATGVSQSRGGYDSRRPVPVMRSR